MFSLSLLSYPQIDPVIFSIGPFALRWYALAYMAGILLGYQLIKGLNRRMNAPLLSPKQLEDMVVWAIIGIMLGGRLGYVAFYNAEYYLAHPSEILAIWKGGMAFHGGLIGVIVAFYLFARSRGIDYWRLMDVVACAAPIGLFFGRMANFINGELYGRVVENPDAVPWAMVFPHGGELPRHPSQLYEAGLEGLVLFATLFVIVRLTRIPQQLPGLVSGMFLMDYGIFRFMIEYFREPDEQLGEVLLDLTMGQWLCVPMMALGMAVMTVAVLKAAKRRVAQGMSHQ